MSVLKQAKALGIAVVLAVLAGCAGQVNESAGPSKIETDAERAAREARQAAFLARQQKSQKAELAIGCGRATQECDGCRYSVFLRI